MVAAALALAAAVPHKLVVLTFDDAVKSHRTVVAPLLQELGFGATFFVTHRWRDDCRIAPRARRVRVRGRLWFTHRTATVTPD